LLKKLLNLNQTKQKNSDNFIEMDLIPWGVTFFTSLLIGLEIGILSGVLISVSFLLHYAARPAVTVKRAEVKES